MSTPQVRLQMAEKHWQQLVVDFARLNGWLVNHAFDSRKSEPGFPDLVLIHLVKGLHVAELKTEKGKVSAEQHRWLEAFSEAGVPAHTWRPSDWPYVESVLSRRRVSARA